MKRLIILSFLISNSFYLFAQTSPCDCDDPVGTNCNGSSAEYATEALGVAAIDAEVAADYATSSNCHDLSTLATPIPADDGSSYQLCYDYNHSGGRFAFESQIVVPDVANCIGSANSTITREAFTAGSCGTALTSAGTTTDGWDEYELAAGNYKLCTTISLDDMECCGIVEGICTYVHTICPEIISSNISGCLATSDDLFISEYIEGSSNNKCIEIYNGTGAAVNLASYTLENYFNGAAASTNTLTLSGTLQPGDVHVVCDDDAVTELLLIADQQFTSTGWFNGDDGIALANGGTIIDLIGEVGNDPGSSWTVGTGSTQNHTLVRDSSNTDGNATGFPASAGEWNPSSGVDDFSSLGWHVMSCNICFDTDVELNVDIGSNLPTGGDILWKYSTSQGFDPFSSGTNLVVASGSTPSTVSFTFDNILFCNTTLYIKGIVDPANPSSCEGVAQTPEFPIYISCPDPSLSASVDPVCSESPTVITVDQTYAGYLWADGSNLQDTTVYPIKMLIHMT